MLDCYFELITDDGNYFCKGNTRLKEMERTLYCYPDAEVITYNADTHEVIIDRQPLKDICKPWSPDFVHKAKIGGKYKLKRTEYY